MTIKAGCEDCVSDNPDDWCGLDSRRQPERCLDGSIECPGVTPDCQAWQECERCRDLTDEQEDEFDRTGDLHGVEHQRVDGYLAVALPGVCYVAIADCLPDAVYDLGVAPGIYPVRAHNFDEGSYELEIVDARKPAEVTP